MQTVHPHAEHVVTLLWIITYYGYFAPAEHVLQSLFGFGSKGFSA